MSDDELKQWRESLADAQVVERGRAELSRLCKGGRWQMSIPVNLNYDSDVILGEALRRLGRGAPPVPLTVERLTELLLESNATALFVPGSDNKGLPHKLTGREARALATFLASRLTPQPEENT